MRKMKDSGIEWIGEIPEEWEIFPAKSLFQERKNKNLFGKEQNLLSLSYGKIIRKSINAVGGLLPANFNGYNIVEPDDIVFRLTDLQNDKHSLRTGLVKEHGIITSAYMTLMSKRELDSRYFYYLFHTYDIEKVFYNLGDGVRQSLKFDNFSSLSLLYPCIQEQQRIADFLDAKCAEIDALTSDIKSQIETLEQYKKSVISEAVTKGLDPNVEMKESGIEWIGEIPETWELSRGKHLFALRQSRGNKQNLEVLSPTQSYGVIPQKKYQELTGMSPVKLKNGIDLNGLKTIHKGDYCISLRSFQGGFEYSEYEGVVSPAYQVFYPIVSVARGYYKYLFKSLSFIKKMNSYTTDLRDGRNIHFSDFGKTYIPFPTVKEQQQIADFLDEKCEKIDAVIATKKEQLEVLAEYKKSLIYEYVTGKREVA